MPKPIHTPQQERSRESLARLLDAASRLLEERPIDEVSVADITGEANLAVGTFYRRFRDKDALLHVLDEALWEENQQGLSEGETEAGLAVLAEGPLPAALRGMIEPVVRSYFVRRGVRRALLLRSRVDPSLRERAAAAERRAAQSLRAFLLARPECVDCDPIYVGRLADLLVLQLLGFLREAVLFREIQAVEVPTAPEAILEDATTMLAGTLTSRTEGTG